MSTALDISAKITGISYKPLLCSELNEYDFALLDDIIKQIDICDLLYEESKNNGFSVFYV